jgi:hypothetical protein
MSYIRKGVQGLQAIGRGARSFQTQAYRGSQFAKRLGAGAKEFNQSRLGMFIGEKVPVAGKISRGIEEISPQIAGGLQRAGDLAGKVRDLEYVNLGEVKPPPAPEPPKFRTVVPSIEKSQNMGVRNKRV